MPDSLSENSSTRRDRQLRRIAGHDIYFDHEGFFWAPEDWSEEAAVELSREMGMAELSEPCWQVIRFMRKFYFFHGRAPMNRDLKNGTGMSILAIEELFPRGIRLGARLLAGLPNPKACL